MLPQHRKAIEALRRRYEADENVLALIVVGSVARGDAGARSDVDARLLVTDADHARRVERGELDFVADDLVPGVHVGGAIFDMAFLSDAAERGPEPTRYAFVKALPVFSRVPGLDALLSRIPVYPENERDRKMASFASQLPVHLSYLELGEYSDNPWLLAQTSTEMVLFGGRLILAYNRMLFPNRKQFLRALGSATQRPKELMRLIDDLMRRPRITAARAFYDSVMTFREWPVPLEGHWARYSQDRETNWRTGAAALADS